MLYLDVDKSLKLGGVLLALFGICACLVAAILYCFYFDPIPSFGRARNVAQDVVPLSIPFDLNETLIGPPIPNIEGEFSVSFDRLRPDVVLSGDPIVTVKLKKSGQIRRVSLSSRIDLLYEKGVCFSEIKSPFWIELQAGQGRQIQVQMCVESDLGSFREVKRFSVTAEESPIRSSADFQEGSPYRILGEARLLGRDLFFEKYGDGVSSQRIEIGSPSTGEIIAVKEGDYLSWKGGKWLKIDLLSDGKGCPIAKIASFDDRSLLLEVWGLDEYLRLSVSSLTQSPLKTKGDEFLTSVRVRSEKQISCMMEKQCFVLRANDWVLKQDNRWKVLRKPQEKDAFIQGKLAGEIFVFDRIDVKGGQKTVHGHLFNLNRSQVTPIDVPVLPLNKQGQDKKGKAK